MDESAQQAPVVSVLIVSHNCVEPLRRCLAAVESSQERDRAEVLVVDNASGDGCATIDDEFPTITVLRLPRHFGATKARNIGVRTAKGEFVLFLSPRVELRPETLRSLAERFEQAGDAGAVSPLLVDRSGNPVAQVRPMPDLASLREVAQGRWTEQLPPGGPGPIAVDFPNCRALLVRRRTILGMNYLDERFGEWGSDADLCFRLRKSGKKLLLFPDLTAIDQGPSGMWEPSTNIERAIFDSDAAVGAAAFAGKHFGFAPGMGIRLGSALRALGSGSFARLSRIASGQKLDGTEPLA